MCSIIGAFIGTFTGIIHGVLVIYISIIHMVVFGVYMGQDIQVSMGVVVMSEVGTDR